MSKSTTYQLKITLKGFKPPIWRRVLISADATFFDLHSLIQDVFSWQDYHLHSFRGLRLNGRKRIYIENPQNSAEMLLPVLEGFPQEIMDRQDEFFDEYTAQLRQYLTIDHPRLTYEYDFGDSWEHEIILERALEDAPSPLPAVISGKRVGPPEDSRGWIDHAPAIVAVGNHRKSKAWEALVADWGPETLNVLVRKCEIFLTHEFDASEIGITSSAQRLKSYDQLK